MPCMSEREQVLAEIHNLIDEQLCALTKTRLTDDEALAYSTRRLRIKELLERIENVHSS
jgi:hypothetical protein